MVRRTLQHRTSASNGFSLIELLVVSGVMVILSTIVLSSNSRFGNHVVLQNLAYDIALSIRQAQVYGIASRGSADGTRFDAAYGMYFQLSNEAVPTSNTYVLFSDTVLPENGRYDGGETVRATTIAGGYLITNLCVEPQGGGAETCNLPAINIAFRRPEPDALIRVDTATTYQKARITIRSNGGHTADILVDRTGQIYVD